MKRILLSSLAPPSDGHMARSARKALVLNLDVKRSLTLHRRLDPDFVQEF
jgi:hypothetical protein